MGAELGRISGPLLAANLQRNGYDLSFADTELSVPVLYLNVNTGRIGINSDSPTKELFVNDTIHTTNLIVDTDYKIPNFIVSSDTIQQTTGSLYIRPNQTNPVISAVALGTSKLRFDNNELSSVDNINFTPTGTGLLKKTNIRNDVLVNGTLHATGNITWDGGTLTLGNSRDDNVTFTADVNSNIIPDNPDGLEVYNLGSPDFRWANVYSEGFHASNIDSDTINATNLFAGNIKITSNTITNTVAGQPIEITPGAGGTIPDNYVYISAVDRYVPNNAVIFSLTCEAPQSYVSPIGANSFRWRTGTGYITRGVWGSSVYSTVASSGLPLYSDPLAVNTTTAFAIYEHNTSNLVALFTVYGKYVGNTSLFWNDYDGQYIYPSGIDYTTFRGLFTTGVTYDWVFVPNVSTFTGYKTAAEILTPPSVANFNGTNYIFENQIRNTTNNPLHLANTGPGYYKIAGSGAVVIPSGETVGPEGAELGMIRFNTELGYVRVFNGTAWVSAMGSSSVLNTEEVTDIMDIWTLILG